MDIERASVPIKNMSYLYARDPSILAWGCSAVNKQCRKNLQAELGEKTSVQSEVSFQYYFHLVFFYKKEVFVMYLSSITKINNESFLPKWLFLLNNKQMVNFCLIMYVN